MKKLIVLVVCLLLGCSTGALATIDPVAHWSFDNPVDLGHDDASNGHNGTGVGDPTSTTGRWGNAVNLDGASYIDVADATDLNPTNAVTITAWFKVSNFHLGEYSWPPIVKKMDNDQTGYTMEIVWVYENNPCLSFTVGIAGQGALQVFDVPKLEENKWYFAAGVYDGTAVRTYVGNSELPPLVVTSLNGSGNIGLSSNNLNIGRDTTNTDRLFEGAIDEVRIFDRAITSDEITNLYLYNEIPEPATLLLLGLGGLSLLRRKRSKA